MSPSVVVWWVRQDQRLHDNPALRAACADALARAVPLLCLATRPSDGPTRWGFERLGPHRRWVAWRSLSALDEQLARHGHRLHWHDGPLEEALDAVQQRHPVVALHAQQGLPPEERLSLIHI